MRRRSKKCDVAGDISSDPSGGLGFALDGTFDVGQENPPLPAEGATLSCGAAIDGDAGAAVAVDAGGATVGLTPAIGVASGDPVLLQPTTNNAAMQH